MNKNIKKSSAQDTPGVLAPPPLIFLSGILLGEIIHWLIPVRIYPVDYNLFSRIIGVFLILAGFAVVYSAHAKMRKAKTNIEPWKPTNSIITDGIYSISRNPVYAAMVLMYFGVVLIFNSLWMFMLLPVVLLVMSFGVITREEKYLEKKFGGEYMNYKNSVRRWI